MEQGGHLLIKNTPLHSTGAILHSTVTIKQCMGTIFHYTDKCCRAPCKQLQVVFIPLYPTSRTAGGGVGQLGALGIRPYPAYPTALHWSLIMLPTLMPEIHLYDIKERNICCVLVYMQIYYTTHFIGGYL